MLLFDLHAGHDRHSGPQKVFVILSLLKKNLHGKPLHNFDVVSRGVFRGQQAESGSACPGDVEDVTVIGPPVRIDGNLSRLVRVACLRAVSP